MNEPKTIPKRQHRPRNRGKKPSQGFPARVAALEILVEVLDKKQPLDITLETTMAKSLGTLEPRDRAFTRALVSVTLRRLGEIDSYIAQFLSRALPKKASIANHILRLGYAQILFLKVPDHAAVDGCVNLAQKEQHARPFKKLINAILRKGTTLKESLMSDAQAAKINTPGWLWDTWVKAYGKDGASDTAIAHLLEAPLDLTLKDSDQKSVDGIEAQHLATGSLRLEKSQDVRSLPGFDEGLWWVQDAAAAMPATLLGDIKDKRVLDLCAAPGGKTMQLAAQGALVTALDRSANRLERVSENLTRVGLEAEIVTADACSWKPQELFPFVLLDAPCSSTGTLRRHPDLAHLKTMGDITKLCGLQSRLLDAAREMLEPGGTLVFCTCSLQPQEGEEQITAFLGRHNDMARAPLTKEDHPTLAEFITQEGNLRTLPSHWRSQGGLDGFFAARLTRNRA